MTTPYQDPPPLYSPPPMTLDVAASGRFDPKGMLLTLLGGLVAGVVVGAALSLLKAALGFSIPIVVPLVAGAIVGGVTYALGYRFGRCRSPALAIGVALLAGTTTWVAEHVTDYLRFHERSAEQLARTEDPPPPEAIDPLIDAWLVAETGHDGVVGFMLLDAASTRSELGTTFSTGFTLPAFELRGTGLIVYWLIELLVTALTAAFFNRSYPKEGYCDACGAWREKQTPVVGTDRHVDDAIIALRAHDIAAAVAALGRDPEGAIARVQLERCPACNDSRGASLVVVRDAPGGWTNETVWADRLPPAKVVELVAARRSLIEPAES